MTNSTVFLQTKGADWTVVAEAYKSLVNATAMASISEMLRLTNAALPFNQATGILDNGCGPGGIMTAILQQYGRDIPPSSSLDCADFSEAMLKVVSSTKEEEIKAHPGSAWSRVGITNLDATDLHALPDDSKSHVLAGWVYFMTSSPQKCLSESRRVLQPDGVLCASSWKRSDWLDLMNLIRHIRPSVELPQIPPAWMSTAGVQGEFTQAGFRDVKAYEVNVQMHVTSYEATSEMLMTKMPPVIAATQDFTKEERAELRRLMEEGLRRRCPSLPGTLSGTSLVAVGRK